jgi:hypothetical protein
LHTAFQVFSFLSFLFVLCSLNDNNRPVLFIGIDTNRVCCAIGIRPNRLQSLIRAARMSPGAAWWSGGSSNHPKGVVVYIMHGQNKKPHNMSRKLYLRGFE